MSSVFKFLFFLVFLASSSTFANNLTCSSLFIIGETYRRFVVEKKSSIFKSFFTFGGKNNNLEVNFKPAKSLDSFNSGVELLNFIAKDLHDLFPLLNEHYSKEIQNDTKNRYAVMEDTYMTKMIEDYFQDFLPKDQIKLFAENIIYNSEPLFKKKVDQSKHSLHRPKLLENLKEIVSQELLELILPSNAVNLLERNDEKLFLLVEVLKSDVKPILKSLAFYKIDPNINFTPSLNSLASIESLSVAMKNLRTSNASAIELIRNIYQSYLSSITGDIDFFDITEMLTHANLIHNLAPRSSYDDQLKSSFVQYLIEIKNNSNTGTAFLQYREKFHLSDEVLRTIFIPKREEDESIINQIDQTKFRTLSQRKNQWEIIHHLNAKEDIINFIVELLPFISKFGIYRTQQTITNLSPEIQQYFSQHYANRSELIKDEANFKKLEKIWSQVKTKADYLRSKNQIRVILNNLFSGF